MVLNLGEDQKYGILEVAWRVVRKFLNVVIIPSIPINNIRVFAYKIIGYKIGKNVFIGMKCYLDDLEPSNMIIGDDVTISYGCYFAAHGRGQGRTKIEIKNDAYIGCHAVLLGGKDGITIGEHSTVGAMSLVNHSVPNFAIVVGNPARIIKYNQN